MEDNECAFCGTKISDVNGDINDMSDVVRQIFVEEDEDDAVSPMRSTPQRGSASLRDLLSRHPSFKETRDVESSSPGMPMTANTSLASISPASVSPKLTKTPSSTLEREDYFAKTPSSTLEREDYFAKTPSLTIKRGDYTEEYAFDLDPKKKEKDAVFNTMGHPIETGSVRCEMRKCLSLPMFLMMLSMVIMLWSLLPKSSTSFVSDEDTGNSEPASQFVGGIWVELEQHEVFADEPNYQAGECVSLANGGTHMAVGVGHSGPVRAYHYLAQEEYWVQLGQDLSFTEGPKHVTLSRTTGQFMAIASETDGSVAVFVLGSEEHLWEPYGDVLTYGVTNDAKASVSRRTDGIATRRP
jgi:hypothetical protein